MWERMQGVVDGSIVVSLDETRRAMRVIAEKARVIAEGAGALPVAAALIGKAGDGPIVAIVSGGNIDLAKFAELDPRRARRGLKNHPRPASLVVPVAAAASASASAASRAAASACAGSPAIRVRAPRPASTLRSSASGSREPM